MDVNAQLSRMMTAYKVNKFKDLALKLGVSPNTIDVWKRRGNVPEKNILKCVNMTGYPIEWIKKGGDLKEKTMQNHHSIINIPLLKGGAGSGIYNYEDSIPTISISSSMLPERLKSRKLIAVEVLGDSMEPLLLQGDYVIASPVKKTRNTEEGIYVIRVEGSIKIKTLQFNLDGTVKVMSLNKIYAPEIYDPKESQIDFEIIGKKVAHLSFR